MARMSRDWYLFVDDNDGEGSRPATKDEVQEFLTIAASRPDEWATMPIKGDVTRTGPEDTR